MKVFGEQSLLARVLGRVRRQGLKSTASSVLELARIKFYLDETHVIYELTLDGERPKKNLPPEFELVKGGENDLPLLNQLSDISEHQARQLLGPGNDLWLVLEGRQTAFACWIYRDAMLISAAQNGRLELTPEIVCLEDSVASPLYRGRGIAPAAWSQIADRLEQSGARYMVTKIEEDNVASRRAVEKSGFRHFATVRFRRVGPVKRTVVQTQTGGPGDWLAARFVPTNQP